MPILYLSFGRSEVDTPVERGIVHFQCQLVVVCFMVQKKKNMMGPQLPQPSASDPWRWDLEEVKSCSFTTHNHTDSVCGGKLYDIRSHVVWDVFSSLFASAAHQAPRVCRSLHSPTDIFFFFYLDGFGFIH